MREITPEMVENATPLELTIINHELLIQAIDKGDLQKARDCVAVLYESLNMDVDFSHDLAGLYVFINVALNRAGYVKDRESLMQATRRVAQGLMEAWQSIEPADVERYMENIGSTLAGLTYGAGGALTEYDDYDPEGGYKI